jgi:exodeoxyribonuclease V alpha subunit
LPEFSNDPHSDCRFIDCESWEEVKHKIKQLVTEVLPPLGWDPKQDVQILTPMNRGELGTQLLNEELQSLLNPPRPHKSEFKRRYFTLRQGDKVIQNSNDYDLSVFNGDIGFVTGAGVEKEKLIVQYNDRTVIYDEEKAAELKLAYAITIHKSQGSEFPVVIVPISMNHYVMLQRNLIYTGLTRAKKLAIFVGSKKALAYAARNQPSLKRQSMLVQRIQHMMQEYDTNR